MHCFVDRLTVPFFSRSFGQICIVDHFFYSLVVRVGVLKVGEEELHRHALLVETEWTTEVESIHCQDRSHGTKEDIEGNMP